MNGKRKKEVVKAGKLQKKLSNKRKKRREEK
jgi:hypothetical protein